MHLTGRLQCMSASTDTERRGVWHEWAQTKASHATYIALFLLQSPPSHLILHAEDQVVHKQGWLPKGIAQHSGGAKSRTLPKQAAHLCSKAGAEAVTQAQQRRDGCGGSLQGQPAIYLYPGQQHIRQLDLQS